EALARRSPPRDLVEEVIAHIDSPQQSPPIARPERWIAVFAQPTGRVYAFAAAIIVVISIGFGVARQRAANEERLRGELATRQLMTALHIASETLNDAQRLVKQAY